MNVDQIAAIPTPTRNALNAVTFMVGVNTAGGMRGSTINGLPESFLNVTLDGISNNDTFNKNTDGFCSPVRPRQDAVEAVTVTTAVGGAEAGGHGGATINFTTRSGTNRFTGAMACRAATSGSINTARARAGPSSATRRSSSATSSRFATPTTPLAHGPPCIRGRSTAGSAIT